MFDFSAKMGEKLMLTKTVTKAASKFSFFKCLKNQKEGNLLTDVTT